jgi:hypothetical protein
LLNNEKFVLSVPDDEDENVMYTDGLPVKKIFVANFDNEVNFNLVNHYLKE